MNFASPHLLWLLPVIPGALVAFLWWAWKRRQVLRSQFVQSRLLASLVAGFSPARQKFRMACLVAAVACLILALARPQWGFSWQEVKQRGLDIVVAVDTSKSMLATDIAPNRLERAKLAALDLMQEAKFDRLGVVAFAGTAFLQCPLTIDDAAFRQSIDSLDVNIIPQGGTALAEAIDVALTAFTEGDNYKALVLITDGEDQDSGALEAAKKAAAAGMRIYTVGVGTPEGELLRIKKPDGSTDYVRDEQGNVVKSHLNEALLQQIAGETEGGFYLPLRGAKTMETLYREGPSRLPKTERQEKLVRQYHERYHWPLALAILLLLLEQLIPERRREPARAPQTAAPAKKAAAATTALVAFAALLVWPAAGSPSSALRDYKRGNYDKAFDQYEQLLRKNTDDPRLHFNAGAAAYQDGRFEEAAKQFNQSLSSQDLRLQEMSYYNRGNAQYQLGERAPDPKQRMDLWQKSLQDFTSSLKLNPQDADARFNQEFVKKRLEELKQQQQQQQQSKEDKSDQNQQQQSQQDQNQQKEQQQPQQQQQGDQKPASQSQQQEQQQAKNDAQQNLGKEQPQPQPQPAKKEESKEQQQAARGKEEQKQEGETAAAAGQMTAEQARQLLDSDKGDEQLLQFKPEGKPREPNRRIRDW